MFHDFHCSLAARFSQLRTYSLLHVPAVLALLSSFMFYIIKLITNTLAVDNERMHQQGSKAFTGRALKFRCLITWHGHINLLIGLSYPTVDSVSKSNNFKRRL